MCSQMCWLSTLRPRRNGCNFPYEIVRCIFLNENLWISLKISLKFVHKVRINNIAALVQIMAWRWPGDKSLSEPVVVRLLTHIWVIRPQWVKGPATVLSLITNKNVINSPGKYGRHFAYIFKCIFLNETFCVLIRISLKFVPEGLIYNTSALFQVMAWRRTGSKPLIEPMLTQFTDAYMHH